MVDYAMDIGEAGTAYERPVQAPQTTSAGIAAGFLGGINDMIDTYQSSVKSGQPTQASINREGFADFSKKVNAVLNKGLSPLDEEIKIRQIITETENQGFEITAAHTDLISRRTGFDATKFKTSSDPNRALAISAYENIKDNPALLLLGQKQAQEIFGPDATDEQALQMAMEINQRDEAAALMIAYSSNASQAEFLRQEPLWLSTLDSLLEHGMAGMAIVNAQGNLSPETIAGFRDRFAIADAVTSIPRSVTTEQFQEVQKKKDKIKGIIEHLATYEQTKLKDLNIDVLGVIAKKIMVDPTAENSLIAAQLLNDNAMETWSAGKITETLKAIGSLSPEDFNYADFSFDEYDTIASTSLGLKDLDDPNVTKEAILNSPEPHPSDQLELGEAQTPEVRLANIKEAANTQISMTTTESMLDEKQGEYSRDLFRLGVSRATLSIHTSPSILKQATLSTVFNPNTYKRLHTLTSVDETTGLVLKEKLKKALHKQKTVWGQFIQAELKDKPATIGSDWKVRINQEGYWDDVTPKLSDGQKAQVQNIHNEYYGGDFEAMVMDRGQKLKQANSQLYSLIQKSNPTFFNKQTVLGSKIREYSEALKFLDKQMLALGATSLEVDTMIYGPTIESTMADLESETTAAQTAPSPEEVSTALTMQEARKQARIANEQSQKRIKTLMKSTTDAGTFNNPYVLYGPESGWAEILRTQVPPNSWVRNPDTDLTVKWTGQ